ncbi:MAG: Holliday junction branch migration protein RuvA [Spartobacteria bacterium]|nr:Holliday junction branch migration protein RuvA [Spartobacteria bacterium]
MITFIEGILAEKAPTRIVVNVHGVGYEVFIPLSSYDRLPAPDKPVRVLTYDYIREDTHTLFGFLKASERDLFTRLLGVSGIGPKIALSALSGMSVRDFKTAIVEADAKRLSSISGIGKKMAERMIIELRDKISSGEALEAVAGVEEGSEADQQVHDAVMALISLGYKQVDAWKMVRKVLPKLGDHPTVENIVRHALVG